MLCPQLQRKANLTAAVSLLRLPRTGEQVEPGMVCSVAGWGQLDLKTTTAKLHEVQLEIQRDEQCISRYKSPYCRATQICVGDPEKNQSTFSVRSPALSRPSPGHTQAWRGPGAVGTNQSPVSSAFPPTQSLVLSSRGR